MVKDKIREALTGALRSLSIEVDTSFDIATPEDVLHGDYTTNVALSHAKLYKLNPMDLGKRIADKLSEAKIEEVSKVEVAPPGFINIYLSDAYFCKVIERVIAEPEVFGRNDSAKGVKTIVEYTDPNPFKEFHIGHLMNNTIGEAISRLAEFSGAEVKRACYQGDMGLNVAKAIWGMRRLKDTLPHDGDPLAKRIAYISEAYVLGSAGYEETGAIKNDINEINAKVFSQNDPEVNVMYKKGREWSLESFEQIYKILGTKFDHYFFESETAPVGKAIVEEHLKDGIFEQSDGAIVFRGEAHGLHTRVFVNSEGFPTYEGKELGLAKIKYERSPYDTSIIITGNEQADYFKVILKAIEIIFPKLAGKNKSITHGMMRLSTGKMSSRKGNVVSAESFINALKEKVDKKISEGREIKGDERVRVTEEVAVGAIKYTILRQSVGKDIIFEEKNALSFEGDSGPYLQYSMVRARSVLKNAFEAGIKASVTTCPPEIAGLARRMYRFPDIVSRAKAELSPQYVVTYLTALSAEFNNFYANNKIVDAKDPFSAYRVALVETFVAIMKNGLWLLGIPVPVKM